RPRAHEAPEVAQGVEGPDAPRSRGLREEEAGQRPECGKVGLEAGEADHEARDGEREVAARLGGGEEAEGGEGYRDRRVEAAPARHVGGCAPVTIARGGRA